MKKVAILYGGLSQGDIFPKCFETHKKNLIDNGLKLKPLNLMKKFI